MKTHWISFKLCQGLIALVVVSAGASIKPASAQDLDLNGPLYRRHGVEKKIIANGWDTPDTAFLRGHLPQMEQNPLDGTAIVVRGQTGNPAHDEECNTRSLWQKWVWQRSWFDQARKDLLACEFDRLGDNFIRINVVPGNVAWFDNEGWEAVANNLALMAELAKDTGLTGFAFDPETYRHHQFTYPIDAEQSFDEYQQMARQRGREIMAAVAEHYPDITILGFRLLSNNMAALPAQDPDAILQHEPYGLYPAFFNGMLDVLPPEITLVEGVEDTYLTNSTQEFLRVYNELRVEALRLVAPENRQKYRAQVQVGAAIYLDTYVNPAGQRWRINDMGQPPVERLRQNLTNALAISDEYVWLWGERSHWFETASTTWHAERQNGQSWQQALPGIERAFAWARNPMEAAAVELEELKADRRLVGVVQNAGFTTPAASEPKEAASDWTSEGLPAHWSSWQKDYSQGTFGWDPSAGRTDPGAVRAVGVRHGCFIQVLAVKPGQQFVIEAHARMQGETAPFMMIRWRKHSGHWIFAYHDFAAQFEPDPQAEAGDWQRAVTVLTVPERATEMLILLYATGKPGEENVVWFDDVNAYEIAPDTLWK